MDSKEKMVLELLKGYEYLELKGHTHESFCEALKEELEESK